MRYCCMFEIITIQMHKLVKIPGIVAVSPVWRVLFDAFLFDAVQLGASHFDAMPVWRATVWRVFPVWRVSV